MQELRCIAARGRYKCGGVASVSVYGSQEGMGFLVVVSVFQLQCKCLDYNIMVSWCNSPFSIQLFTCELELRRQKIANLLWTWLIQQRGNHLFLMSCPSATNDNYQVKSFFYSASAFKEAKVQSTTYCKRVDQSQFVSVYIHLFWRALQYMIICFKSMLKMLFFQKMQNVKDVQEEYHSKVLPCMYC